MQRICPLIPLTLFWAGVTSAFVLVPQDEAVTVPVGESVTLRCTMEGAEISSYYMNWYRKTQVNTLTFIFRKGGTYGPGFQHRFRGNIDNSNNQVLLEILKASEEDEGSYFCAGEYHPDTGPPWSSSKTMELYTEQQFPQHRDFLLNE
ncbi:hypothetical protein MC885_020690 [Smutsia gigantea]|nr:hypothetical protein MC885_020690 [Smutsia gigantea]